MHQITRASHQIQLDHMLIFMGCQEILLKDADSAG